MERRAATRRSRACPRSAGHAASWMHPAPGATCHHRPVVLTTRTEVRHGYRSPTRPTVSHPYVEPRCHLAPSATSACALLRFSTYSTGLTFSALARPAMISRTPWTSAFRVTTFLELAGTEFELRLTRVWVHIRSRSSERRVGLPVGLQFIGAVTDEADLLRIAHAFELARPPLCCPPLSAFRSYR